VARKPGHRGEHEISRKTIAQGMPGETGVTVVRMLVCFFISHARLRARRASGIPCALCFRGRWLVQNSGASRREIAESYLLSCLKIESESLWRCSLRLVPSARISSPLPPLAVGRGRGWGVYRHRRLGEHPPPRRFQRRPSPPLAGLAGGGMSARIYVLAV
jgi:hypothetical protein